MRQPCNDCPWRRDAPREHWHPDHFEDIWLHCQDDGVRIMLCHKATALPEHERHTMPCQGWVRVVGRDAIGVRLALMAGTVAVDEADDSDRPDLFASFEEMLAANRVTIPPRNHKRPRPRSRRK